MKLYDFPASPNCQKVRAVLYELEIPFETAPVHLFKGETRTPEYLAKNPNGKAPLISDGDFVLWESNAILGYLASKDGPSRLLPVAARERADVERWLFWQAQHLAPAVSKVAFERVVKKLQGRTDIDQAAIDQGTSEFDALAAVLDRSLGSKEYVAGKLSIADFALAPYFNVGQMAGLSVEKHAAVKAWLGRVNARESMKRTLADAERSMRS